ncbi:MAG: ABC transporter permease [Anaerolineales bacterium]|nr:ABC transporter permease [Anaerolineales bacterium]MCW5856548.1 ABC transporter permease [Anaerolineales bacterium]
MNAVPSRPPATLFKVAWRYLLSHPLQSLLMLLGITLGVAVAVSVDVANASAARAFDLSVDAVVGRSTHYISAGPTGIPEQDYVELRLAGLELPMAPVVSQLVTSPQMGDLPLQLLGVDPFAEEPFRDYLYDDQRQIDPALIGAFYTVPGAVMLSSDMAAAHGLATGDSIQLDVGGVLRPATIAGLLTPQDALDRRALEGLVLADISTVQEFSGRLGVLERVDLILPSGDAAALARLQAALPAGLDLQPAEGRSQAVEQMTGAFRTNLTALSLLGLVVGLFLIYNTMTFSVVQRRQSFGTLRALGVSSREVFILVLGEAMLVGLVGSALGILLGVVLGRGAVDQVAQTINDVFFTLTVREVSLPASSLVKGGLLGIVATLLAALVPAWEAAKSPPRRTMSRSQLELISTRLLGQAALLGALLALASGALLASVPLGLVGSFACTFGVTIGMALTTPWITRGLMPWLARLLGGLLGPLGRLAPREVSAATSRTSPAIAALMVAVAVSIGASLMVSSFRGAVIDWLDQILSNDVYGSVASASLSEPAVPINPHILAQLDSWPGVLAVHSLRNIEIDSPYGPLMVSANNNPNDGHEQIYVEKQGTEDEVWAAVQEGAVMISEPLANRLELGMGDVIELQTPGGLRAFPIAAVFRDYTSSRGNVTMWQPQYQTIWNDPSISAFSLLLETGTDPEAVVEELRQAFNATQFLNIRSNAGLRAETLEVFDRTFLISSALELITTAVAFVGVLSAMLALLLEKQRQMGVLKAIGMSLRQLWGLTLLETGLMGLVAGLLALPTGYFVAQILLQIINKRSFGWALDLRLTPQPFVEALLIAVAAALLAGLYPAHRASQRSAADAMRFD